MTSSWLSTRLPVQVLSRKLLSQGLLSAAAILRNSLGLGTQSINALLLLTGPVHWQVTPPPRVGSKLKLKL